jgi:cytochrome c oxidase subunit 2
MEQGLPLFPPSASSVAPQVDALYAFLIGVSLFFSLLICSLILVFAVRYRRVPGGPPAQQVLGSLPLELLWTLIPLAIAMVIFFWSARVYLRITTVPETAFRVDVTAKQWMWKLQHPTGQREINELHVPAGVPVRLRMISQDVIHSFFVPAFRVKRDVLPGRYSEAWFEATRPGVYHLFCAEYCGTKHSEMIGKVHVLDPRDYEGWLAAADRPQTPRESGERLFANLRCDTCHASGSDQRGPDLAGRFGRTVELEGGGQARFDADYVRESVLAPNARVTRGHQPLMPTYAGQVDEEQILHLVAYLEALAAPAGRSR